MIIKSDSVKNIAVALCDAQAEMGNAEMNSTNPHFRSRYADLASVREAILGPLNKHGIAITQIPAFGQDRGFFLATVFLHKASGEYIGGVYPIPLEGSAQQIGSAITYARRYSAAGMAFVAAEEDDDGNAAQEAPKPQQARRVQPPKPANDNLIFTKLKPQKLDFDGNYVNWGVAFCAQINAAESPEELRAWVELNSDIIDAEKPERIQSRIMEVVNNRLTQIDQPQENNKTDARKPGAAKSAADDLDSYRAALLAAKTQQELDAVYNTHGFVKKDRASATTMYQTREARMKGIKEQAAA